MKDKKRLNVKKMAIIGILGAISAVLGMTPLGFIPVGPTRATIMHIPVIIGAIMEGPVVGAFVGLIFGMFSIFQAITNPTPVSVVFLNPLVSVVPRILIGIVTYYVYDTLRKLGNKKTMVILYLLWIAIILYLLKGIYGNIINLDSIYALSMNIGLLILTLIVFYITTIKYKNSSLDIILSTIAGTITNTGLVLTMIYLFYGTMFVEKLGLDPNLASKIIFGIGITNGIPEGIIAIIIVSSVVNALRGRKRIEGE